MPWLRRLLSPCPGGLRRPHPEPDAKNMHHHQSPLSLLGAGNLPGNILSPPPAWPYCQQISQLSSQQKEVTNYQLWIKVYSLVLKERHVSLVPHMTLIRPNTLPIKGAMTLFWINPFCKCIVMPLFRIIPKFWEDFVYWKQPVCLDMSLFRINTLSKCIVMPLIKPNTQPKCATITLFPHMPLFRHQRVTLNVYWIHLITTV